jgi:glycosyltransferase involved in cell wall biosynthesis
LFLTASEMMNQALSPLIPLKKMRILRNPGLAITHAPKKSSPRNGWLFAGRFVDEKGIIELINAWPKSETLHIAGSGPLQAEIESRIAHRPEIKLIGTFPPGTADLYHHYEGLIFPSTWLEGSPLVIADALSTGTPVIAMGSSASKEQVEVSKAGVVIPEDLTIFNLLQRIVMSWLLSVTFALLDHSHLFLKLWVSILLRQQLNSWLVNQ